MRVLNKGNNSVAIFRYYAIEKPSSFSSSVAITGKLSRLREEAFVDNEPSIRSESFVNIIIERLDAIQLYHLN